MAMSVMEVHADSISDLLSPEPRRRLQVKQVNSAPVPPPVSLPQMRRQGPQRQRSCRGRRPESRQQAPTL